MPSRRFHSKNRHGCIPCKTRRVKCNLERPICSNCARRNDTCILIGSEHEQTPAPAAVAAATATNQLSILQARRSNLVGSMRPLNMDLYFLERYFSHICPTLSSKPETQRNWATTITATTVNTDSKQPHYLTHLQIAISELHYSLTESDTTVVTRSERSAYLENSIYHQNAALAMLRPVLESSLSATEGEGVTGEGGIGDVRALFGAAWLIFLFNLTFPRGAQAKKDWIVDEIVEVSELAKGVVAIMLGAAPSPHPSSTAASASGSAGRGGRDDGGEPTCFASQDDEEAKTKIMTGPLRPFFSHFLPWKHERVPASVRRQHLPTDAQTLFNMIESMSSTTTTNSSSNSNNGDEKKRDLYMHAIAELELTVTAMRIHTQHPSIAFMWLIGTRREFMELIATKRDEVALSILRVYGVVMQELEGYWWAKGLGRMIVEGVDVVLGGMEDTFLGAT